MLLICGNKIGCYRDHFICEIKDCFDQRLLQDPSQIEPKEIPSKKLMESTNLFLGRLETNTVSHFCLDETVHLKSSQTLSLSDQLGVLLTAPSPQVSFMCTAEHHQHSSEHLFLLLNGVSQKT